MKKEKWWPGRRPRGEMLLLAGILILATLLRTAFPRLTEFKFSEARLEALALELTREGRLPLVGVPSSGGFDHSPLSVYLYVPAFLATTNPIPATVYGGLVGAAAVALCWWAGRRWAGGGLVAAAVAALLLATNPWAVAFSRKIWQITFVPLLSLAVLALLLNALVGTDGPAGEGQAATQARRRHGHLAWALFLYAVLLQVHPSAVSLAPAVLLWLVVFWRQVRLRPLLAGAGLGALTAIPFLIHQLQAGWPLLRALQQLPEATWDLDALRLAWEAITGRGIQVLAGEAQFDLHLVPQFSRSFNLFSWLAVASALVLAWRAARGWKSPQPGRRQAARVDLVLLSWLLVPVLYNLQHSLDLHLHFFALILPAACLVAGRGIETVLDWLQPATTRRAVVVGGATLIGLIAAAQVLALVLVLRFVATRSTSGGFGTPLGVYLAAADRAVEAAAGNPVLVVSPGYSPAVDEVPAIFDVLLRDRVAYRFVDGEHVALFPAGPAIALLTPEAGKAAAWYDAWPSEAIASDYPEQYRVLFLDGTWPTSGLSQIEGPRLFQSGVEVQGYNWEVGSEPDTGGQLWLLWQVLWRTPADTHFSIRLLDEIQQEWGRHDAIGYPFDQRCKGDRVLSLFDITRTAEAGPAASWLWIGLYSFPEIVPVPVIDQLGNPVDDAILLHIEE